MSQLRSDKDADAAIPADTSNGPPDSEPDVLGTWPEPLIDLDLVIWVTERDDAPLDAFLDRLKRYPNVRVTGETITGVLRESTAGVRGRMRVAREKRFPPNQRAVRINLDLLPEGPAAAEGELTLYEFMRVLAPFSASQPDAQRVLTFSSFRLPFDRWQSTIPVPVTLPGVLDSAAGAPEVAGFEFAFRDETSELERAHISVFAPTPAYNVRLMHRIALDDATTLYARAFEANLRDLLLLATPTQTESEE